MKKYILLLAILVMGMLIGMWISRAYYVNREMDEQRDTTYIYEKVPYSRLDLGKMAVQLSVPEVSVPDMVFIREDSTTIIYKDSVRYVTLPRQYYFTSTEDVEIWHSGVDSTIDSLNVFRKTTNVTEVYKPKEKRHSIGIGMETTYSTVLSTPLYLEYEYMPKSWLSVYGQVSYDLPNKMHAVGVGLKLQIGW